MTYCTACKTHNGKHALGCTVAFPAPAPVDSVEALRAKVLLMRELGVTEADGIKLGPAPQPPKKEETEEEFKERQAKIMQRQHDIMFAHSSTRPVLRTAK
jgi:hypothetical protein